ncbi:MAG: Lrp/AsnC family transcriptional regulator [Candidatus Pacearchaeota archaeon]|nr:MAG: Lrp/AsnC family transcriptional regulator [Candidatus Pacearchaeota archaeon]
MKIDKIDRKLLSYLYHNYREPLTKIAKACKLSKDQVGYRVRKYEKEGFIKKYITIFNYNLLGYNEFIVVWLKLKKNKESIKKKLEGMKNVVSVGDIITNYNLFIDFVSKDKQEFERVFYSFLKKHEREIQDYSIFIITYAEFFPLKGFGISDVEKTYTIVSSVKPIKIDKKSLEVLKTLENNGRVRIIDIAEKTGLSSELILYKLKQFYKKKIILGMRIQFDMEKLGFYFGVLRIKLKNQTEEIKSKIKKFCKNYKNINALSFGISEYNCLIQIFYQQEEEFRQTIRDINKEFKGEIEKSEIVLIENEGRVKTLPY